MRNRKDKKTGITLIALVITIVIMLLLAGVAIQMTMGENGLIAKSVQAQKEQAKAELYDTAKLSYMSLNTKALENGQPSPNAELALSTTEFTNKYNVVGDDVTDKNGNVIDTKANVLNIIQGTVAGGLTSGTTPGGSAPAESWPKTVGGVTIPEEDKDKMILKLKILTGSLHINFRSERISVDYGNGIKRESVDIRTGETIEYQEGEYILKASDFRDFRIMPGFGMYYTPSMEIEILQWGKIETSETNEDGIYIHGVSKIYEPEPDKIVVGYTGTHLTEIPEWLFSKKVTNKKLGIFRIAPKLNKIPENLFKNNVNVESFEGMFQNCDILEELPENLFKYNTKVLNFNTTFLECRNLKNIPSSLFKYNTEVKEFTYTFKGTPLNSIPEDLFKYNTKVESFKYTFSECWNIKGIPENLFKHNTEVKEFDNTFWKCTTLKAIPENLFKYNVKVRNFDGIFIGCDSITEVPGNLFKYNIEARNFSHVFYACENLKIIGNDLFRYNLNAENFDSVFGNCRKLENVPENLFNNNNNINKTIFMFANCNKISRVPNDIIEVVKKVKERGGEVFRMFEGCTSASNYTSIPNYMK